MRRRTRTRVAWLAALLLLVGAWIAAPIVMRRLAFFRVRQVELVGVRNLSPDVVIATLRLPAQASVFGDLRLLADRVRGVAGVADARVVRRLPGALRVIVREVEPAALVPSARGLTVVDAAARPLPFDPARAGLDLPVAASGDSGVVAALALVQATDPALFAEVGTARAVGRGSVLLELASGRVLLGRDAGPEVIRAVALVAQDLAARGRRAAELDARYAGQVVVRRPAPGEDVAVGRGTGRRG
ncbi:MAG: cell division protein FtsQ/DivIB [Gemmatimonadales bacterium]